jgi:hypothetical protein
MAARGMKAAIGASQLCVGLVREGLPVANVIALNMGL